MVSRLVITYRQNKTSYLVLYSLDIYILQDPIVKLYIFMIRNSYNELSKIYEVQIL